MAPYPKITTFPPIGRLTVVPPGQDHIDITLVIEWNHVRPAYLFEISVCYSCADTSRHESQWQKLALTKVSDASVNVLDAEDCQRLVFTGKLSKQDLAAYAQSTSPHGHYLFTFRVRVNDQAPWQYISTLTGSQPGELVLQRANKVDIFESLELSSEWLCSPLTSEEPIASVHSFLLESKSPITKTGTGTTLSGLPLALIPLATRSFSVVRQEPYWLGPCHGKGSFFYIGQDAIVTSFLLKNGLVVTFVALAWTEDVYQVFQSDEQGRIVVAARNDTDQDRHYRVVASTGLDFQQTMSSAIRHVHDIIVASSTQIANLQASLHEVLSSIDIKDVTASTERWFDSLAFCTWNALGLNLTESNLFAALEQLRENDIQISTLLIDDNWQTLGPTLKCTSNNNSGLDHYYIGHADIEANSLFAPSGLKDLVGRIRSTYPEIRDIGVWHALMGYWGCFSPNSPITDSYSSKDFHALLMGNVPAKVTALDASSVHRFYDEFYAFLKSCGLTFVKTDVQHMLSMYQDAEARRELTAAYQSAWTRAHLRYFGGKAISCMAHIPQTLFHSLLIRDTVNRNGGGKEGIKIPLVLLRNSDDFYPEVPASHPWHIWVNAHNAYFTRCLNVVLDWDMFQTSHDYSAYHAAARCVSGGAIFITDTPGCHNIALIRAMTARAFDGRHVTLRTSLGARVGIDGEGSNAAFGGFREGGVLAIGAIANAKTMDWSTAGVLLALFNVTEHEVRCLVKVDATLFRFGLQEKSNNVVGTNEVLIRGYQTGEIFGPVDLSRGSSGVVDEMKRLIHVRLPVRGSDILTIQPIQSVETAFGQWKVCVLGLLEKLSGAAAITTWSILKESDKVHVQIGLKALGMLGIWFDGRVNEDSFEVEVDGSRIDRKFLTFVSSVSAPRSKPQDTRTDSVPPSRPRTCRIDLDTYWEESNKWRENCDEVVVDLTVS